MKYLRVAVISCILLASVSTTLIYIASLWLLVGSRMEDISSNNIDVPKLVTSNHNTQISLNFTNDLAHILHDNEWPSLNESDFIVTSKSGEQHIISMHQQLHCLNILRMAYLSLHIPYRPRLSPTQYEESEMCIEQLRQMVVCAADLTLEPTVITIDKEGVILPGSTGVGVLHRCNDWRRLNTAIEK